MYELEQKKKKRRIKRKIFRKSKIFIKANE